MSFRDLRNGPLLWKQMIARKESSSDSEERTSIFAGFDMRHAAPVFIPLRVFSDGHYHVSGRTGSGKTASTLTSLALQVLRNERLGGEGTRCPLVILDLKGDNALFHAVRDAAIERGRTFRYFSTRVGDDYHFFDPFQLFRLGGVTPIQLASEFVRAFSLDYGLVYGGLYFTHQNVAILLDAVKEMIGRGREPTIGALSRILDRMAQKSHNQDARHIQLCLKFLAEYPQVNIASQKTLPAEQIDMLRVLEDCEVVYFSLKLDEQAPTLRQIAALALYTLVHAASERSLLGKPRRETFLLIDEFFHIAGRSFGDLLSTVRYLGLRCVLANQTREQLEHHDAALPSVVDANTAIQQAFTLTNEEAQQIAAESGAVIDYQRGYNRGPQGDQSTSASEYWTYHLRPEDLQEVSDTKLASLLSIRDGTHQPGERTRKVHTLYPLSKALYDRYESTPFPRRAASTESVAQPAPPKPPDNPPPKAGATERRSPQAESLHARMLDKWEDLKKEETPSA